MAVLVTTFVLALASAAAAQDAPAVDTAVGPPGASSRFEVFLDFSDEASSRLAVVLDALRHHHPDDVRIVVRHLPREDDLVAALLHRAAMAAGRQERFWEMARLILANQDRASRQDLLGMAAQLQLDVERFVADLEDPVWAHTLQEDRGHAIARRVSAAPAVLHNGEIVQGDRTLNALQPLVQGQRTTATGR